MEGNTLDKLRTATTVTEMLGTEATAEQLAQHALDIKNEFKEFLREEIVFLRRWQDALVDVRAQLYWRQDYMEKQKNALVANG